MTTAVSTTPMKVVCDRLALIATLDMLDRVVPERCPQPVLECVLIAAEDGKLCLTARDVETFLAIPFDQVEVMNSGKAVIPLRHLRAALNAISEPTVKLVQSSTDLILSYRGGDVKLNGYDTFDFPATPHLEDATDVKLPGHLLSQMLCLTTPVTALEYSRYSINGVQIGPGHIVATDGRCLSVFKHNIAIPFELIMPRRDALIARRLLKDDLLDCTLYRSGHQYKLVTGDGITLQGSNVNGAFPPWPDVVPPDKDLKTVVRCDAQDITDAMRRVMVTCNEFMPVVRCSVDVANQALTIQGRGVEISESTTTIQVDADGEDGWIGLNPKFVCRITKRLQGEIIMKFGSHNRPAIIAQGDFFYVIMPVNMEPNTERRC